jgi:hypothetical protein
VSEGIDETRWLLAVDNIIKSALEEYILDIELVNGLGAGDGNLEKKPDGGGLDNGADYLAIVDARALRVAPNNPSSLAARESAMRVELITKDSLAGNHVCMRWTRNQRPVAIVKVSLVLLYQSRPLEKVLKGLLSRRRDDNKGCHSHQ